MRVPILQVLLFVLLATFYSIIVPVFEGNDESWHYAYARYIAEGRGLPCQPPDRYPHLARQEASRPPLYYLLVAVLIRWVPQEDLSALYARENPYPTLLPIAYRDNQNHYVHTDAEQFPYRGAALAIHLARFLSVLFGAGTVWGTYRLAQELFPREEGVAAGASMMVALTPGFLFTAGLVNNDVLATCLATWTLVVHLLIRRAYRGRIFHYELCGEILLGLLLGAAALTKLSGLLLWPFVAMMLVFKNPKDDFLLRLRRYIVTFGVALAICGWWYLRNWYLYNDPTGLSAMLALMGHRELGFGLREWLQSEAELVWMSYWAVFGWFNLAAPRWVYGIYALLVLLGTLGLARFVIRAVQQKRWSDLSGVAYLGLWALIMAAGLVRWTLITGGSQGRLLYPAISAHAILLALGWAQLCPARARRWLFLTLIGILLALAFWLPFEVIRPAYARPKPLTTEEVVEQVSQLTDIRFGENIRLLGYRVDAEEVRPSETFWVTLCWQAEGPVAENYLLSLSLQTADGLTAAHKVTYHGLGTFPTSLWLPGVAFCDHYPLAVRDTVPLAASGVLAVGLTTFTERLPVYENGRLGDTFLFPGPRIAVPDSGPILNYRWGQEVALVSYHLERAVLTPGEELDLILYWRALRPLGGPRSATVQILRKDGYKIAQTDLPLTPGSLREIWADHRKMLLAADAPPGVYELKVAIYDPTSGVVLPVYQHGRALPVGGLLPLWEIRVENQR